MKLRALRKRTIARMGPVQAITLRRLSREMSAVFVAAFEAQANQSRVLVQGIKGMVRREVLRSVVRPIVADLARSLSGIGSSMFAGPPQNQEPAARAA